MRIAHGTVSAALERREGHLYLHDLRGEGDPADMIAFIRKVQRLSEKVPVYLAFGAENHDRLKEIARRFGGVSVVEVWRISTNGS